MFDDVCSTFLLKECFAFDQTIRPKMLKRLAGFSTLLNLQMLYNNVRSFSPGFTRSIFELCTRAVSCVIRSVVFEFSPQRDLKRNRRFRRPQSAVCGYPTESSDYAWGPGGAKNRLENNRSNIERVKVKFGSSAPCD